MIKSPALDDVLIRKLLFSHDPDGRYLDSDRLLYAIENIMLYSTIPQVPATDFCSGNTVKEEAHLDDVIGSELSLTQTIIKISHEIWCRCSKEESVHEKTMSLLDSLAHYRWDDKAVLALSAFAKSYGEFWLLIHLYPKNPLAVSVAILKQLPSDISSLSRQFKALGSLMRAVVDLTKKVVFFEALPLSHVNLGREASSVRELHIYSSVYWILRSILTCSYQISEVKAMKPEQYSDTTTIAIWELSSLVHRLKEISNHLKKQVMEISEKSEEKLYQSLLTIFNEDHKENQQVLKTLFAFRDDFPLIHCLSQTKVGLVELKNKVVILFVSKLELLQVEDLLLLIQQHNRRDEEIYEIVWIPILDCGSWNESEKRSFRAMTRSLPWCSIKQPWSLNSAAVRYIRQAWKYKDEPLMAVLDSNGKLTNLNAMDMVFIWGPTAHPFSASREQELWRHQKWTLQFLVDEIDPLLTKWVEEERYICIYGSSNMDWILELNTKVTEIQNSCFKLEMVYVGKRKMNNTRENWVNHNIFAKIENGDIRSLLSRTRMQFFWLRLESMQRSKLRLGFEEDGDLVLREVLRLIEMDEEGKDWAIIGRGDSEEAMVRVEQPSNIGECLEKCFSSAPNKYHDVDQPCCGHSKVITNEVEDKIEGTEACEKCGHTMNKFFVYKPKNETDY